MRLISSFLIVMVLAACGGEEPEQLGPTEIGPTRGIILISIDTLRADHLSAYGYPRDTSPFFDSLAERGALFERAVIQYPSTLTSHMSIFTGLFPQEHEVFPPDSVLAKSIQTIPEILQRAAFRTAGHTEGGFVAGHFGFSRGFETYTDPQYQSDFDVENTFQRGLEFLRGLSTNDRFFLFLHTYAVHDPYEPPEAYRNIFLKNMSFADADSSGERLRRINQGLESIDLEEARYFETQYDATIRWVDDVLRGFFDELGNLDLRSETTIIITSDHGEEFLEHGKMAHTQVYPECVKVPLLIVHPKLEHGVRIPQFVQSVDIAPTINELAGLPPWRQPSGSNLLPLLNSDLGKPSSAYAEIFDSGHVRMLMTRDSSGEHQFVTSEARRDPKGTWVSRRVSFNSENSQVELDVQSFARPRLLEVLVDGRILSSVRIQTHWTPVILDLPPGNTPRRITLNVDDCVSPRELGVGDDSRCLGFQVGGPTLRWSELYDLHIDPLAQIDLIGKRIDIENRISNRLSLLRWTSRSKPTILELTDEQKDSLEVLGYLDRSN